MMTAEKVRKGRRVLQVEILLLAWQTVARFCINIIDDMAVTRKTKAKYIEKKGLPRSCFRYFVSSFERRPSFSSSRKRLRQCWYSSSIYWLIVPLQPQPQWPRRTVGKKSEKVQFRRYLKKIVNIFVSFGTLFRIFKTSDWLTSKIWLRWVAN